MSGYLTRDRLAIAAGLLLPLAAAAILMPFRSSWSNTNVALLLVVVVVGVSAIGSRVAGVVARCRPWRGSTSSSPCLTTGSPSAARLTSPPPSCCCSPGWPCQPARGQGPAAQGGHHHRRALPGADPRGGGDQRSGAVSGRDRGLRRRAAGAGCWGWSRPASSTGRCSVIRRGWSRTAASPRAGSRGTWNWPACRGRRSSCGRSATGGISAGSCSRPGRTPAVAAGPAGRGHAG